MDEDYEVSVDTVEAEPIETAECVEDVAEDIPVDIPEDVSADDAYATEELPEEMPMELPEDSADTDDVLTEDIPNDTFDEIPEDLPDAVEEAPADDMLDFNEEVPDSETIDAPEVTEEQPDTQDVSDTAPEADTVDAPEAPEEQPDTQDVSDTAPETETIDAPDAPEEQPDTQDVSDTAPETDTNDAPEAPETQPDTDTQDVSDTAPEADTNDTPDAPEEQPDTQDVSDTAPETDTNDTPDAPEEQPDTQDVSDTAPEADTNDTPDAPEEQPDTQDVSDTAPETETNDAPEVLEMPPDAGAQDAPEDTTLQPESYIKDANEGLPDLETLEAQDHSAKQPDSYMQDVNRRLPDEDSVDNSMATVEQPPEKPQVPNDEWYRENPADDLTVSEKLPPKDMGGEMSTGELTDTIGSAPENHTQETASNKYSSGDPDPAAGGQSGAASLADYMSAHNYGREDYATYSQDPEWRALMRKEYPETELPPIRDEKPDGQRIDNSTSYHVDAGSNPPPNNPSANAGGGGGNPPHVPEESVRRPGSLIEYLSAHNYGREDYATYSQDPEWRALMRKEYPETELPPMSQENAQSQLMDYMSAHNYGQEDFAAYSQDPVWRELQQSAYPDYDLPPIRDELSGGENAEIPVDGSGDGVGTDFSNGSTNIGMKPADVAEGELFGSFKTDKHINGSDSFIMGDHYEQFKKDYYSPEESTYQAFDTPKVVDVSPSAIEGIHIGEQEMEDPSVFWSQHETGGTVESFKDIASRIPDVREQLESGKTVDELMSDPELSECTSIYFKNMPRVVDHGDYYEFDSNGRHRILAARELGYDIPVEVIGQRSNGNALTQPVYDYAENGSNVVVESDSDADTHLIESNTDQSLLGNDADKENTTKHVSSVVDADKHLADGLLPGNQETADVEILSQEKNVKFEDLSIEDFEKLKDRDPQTASILLTNYYDRITPPDDLSQLPRDLEIDNYDSLHIIDDSLSPGNAIMRDETTGKEYVVYPNPMGRINHMEGQQGQNALGMEEDCGIASTAKGINDLYNKIVISENRLADYAFQTNNCEIELNADGTVDYQNSGGTIETNVKNFFIANGLDADEYVNGDVPSPEEIANRLKDGDVATLAVNHDLMWNWDDSVAFQPEMVDEDRYSTDTQYAKRIDTLMKMQDGGVFKADHFVNVSNAVYNQSGELTHFIVSDTGNGTTKMVEKDYLLRAYYGIGNVYVTSNGCVIAGRKRR